MTTKTTAKRTKLLTADEVLAKCQPGDALPGMSTGERWKIIQPVLAHLSSASQQTLYLYLHSVLNSERGDDQRSFTTLTEDLDWVLSTTKRVAGELQDLDLIRREQVGRHGSVTVMLLPTDELRGLTDRTPATARGLTHRTPKTAKGSHKGSHQKAQGVSPDGPKPRGTKETKRRSSKKTTPRRSPFDSSAGGIKRVNGSAEPISVSEANHSSSTRRTPHCRNGFGEVNHNGHNGHNRPDARQQIALARAAASFQAGVRWDEQD